MSGIHQSSMLFSPTSKSMCSSSINPMLTSNPLLSSSIDEKSQKDITEILNKCIESTRNVTEFSKVLQIDNINAPTISGHTDFYYPNLTYQYSHYKQELPEISKIKHVPIPVELLEQFSQMQINCTMGLFTCISRAWLTIDNLIFFWNYEDGSDICFYDNLLEPILAAELFVTKEGTFDNGIEYGLCLATNSQVVLLSVDFIRYTKGNGAIVNEMRFSPQPVYSIPTDNLIINTLKSAKSTGRIFMGAKDGSLYEFFYQNQTSWFSSQTKKINLSHSKLHYLVPSFLSFNDADSIVQIEIDETRQILYTRSENSTIQVFYLGSNGLDTSKISSLSCGSIASKAANLLDSHDKHLFMPIIHISALKQSESKNINLVAVTQFGIRLYFSVSPFEQFQQMISSDQAAPSTFQLVHVRIPSSIELSSHNRNGPVSSAYISNGISLMMTKRNEQNDTVLLLNRDLFILHNNYKESKCIFDIDGRIWSCEEILPSLNDIRASALENDNFQTIKSASGIESIPKLSSEYFDMPRRFAMITPQGCFIWNKMRPIDQLTICLRESNGPNSDSVRLFFNKIYEKSEACSLCLAVALSHSGDARVFEWATQAYFMYSGEPEIRRKSSYSFGSSNPITQPQSNQPFNHHNSLIDSGMEQNENSIYDVTMINRMQQPKTAFNSVSILNSPQQMSTPIVMRTKDNFQAQSRPFRNQSNIPTQPVSSVPQQKSECEIYFSGKHDAIYIYLSRLLSPIWDIKLLDELPGSRIQDADTFNLTDSAIFATFADIHIQWFLNRLNELRSFIELNYPQLKTVQHSPVNGSLFGFCDQVPQTAGSSRVASTPKFATQFHSLPLNQHALNSLTSAGLPLTEKKIAEEIELGSIYLIKQFLNRIIEIFGLWKILDDHKFHFISTKLDKQTQMMLMNMQIKNFLLSDDSVLDQLITALLYRYIDDNACTDLLNQSLKQMCPSLYTNENAIFSKACEKLKQALNIKNDSYERDRLLKEAVDLVKQIGYVANLNQVCEMLYTAGCYEAIFELCISAAEKRDPQNIALYFYKKNEPPEDIQGQNYYQLRTECYKCMLESLNNLAKTPSYPLAQQKKTGFSSKEKLEEEINYLIRYVVSSKDELAQVSLFNWMINNGFEKKLVTLDSTFLEFYLIRQYENQIKNRVYLDLLWRHYDYKKDYIKASKVLKTLAEKENANAISLRERVEYLTQAIVALNSSQKSSVKDEIAELNDRKDVALLQEKIFEEISKIEPRTQAIEEAMTQLDSKLFDITKLFYDFAEKFELSQHKLAIFKMSRHEDPKFIEFCWKQIVANEIDKLNRPDIKDLKYELSENLVSIAKDYVDDEKYFPLNSLIDSLEFVSLARGFEPEWCCSLLRRLNLPFEQLIEAYHEVFLKRDIKWAENSSRFINTIYCLIELFTKAPRATSETDKVFFLRSVKDLIPKYLTELSAINDELSKELITRFKSINCILERM